MSKSSYEIGEFYLMKATGKTRVLLILLLPFSLPINLLTITFVSFYRIFRSIFKPKTFIKEIFSFFPRLAKEFLTTVRRAVSGVFEIDAEDIMPSEFEKLNKGKPINHPLFGNSFLIEIEVLDKLKGKIRHIRPGYVKKNKAS